MPSYLSPSRGARAPDDGRCRQVSARPTTGEGLPNSGANVTPRSVGSQLTFVQSDAKTRSRTRKDAQRRRLPRARARVRKPFNRSRSRPRPIRLARLIGPHPGKSRLRMAERGARPNVPAWRPRWEDAARGAGVPAPARHARCSARRWLRELIIVLVSLFADLLPALAQVARDRAAAGTSNAPLWSRTPSCRGSSAGDRARVPRRRDRPAHPPCRRAVDAHRRGRSACRPTS